VPIEHRRVLEVARSDYQGEAPLNWDELRSDARAFAAVAEREIREAGSS
jgi:hypothetical protein